MLTTSTGSPEAEMNGVGIGGGGKVVRTKPVRRLGEDTVGAPGDDDIHVAQLLGQFELPVKLWQMRHHDHFVHSTCEQSVHGGLNVAHQVGGKRRRCPARKWSNSGTVPPTTPIFWPATVSTALRAILFSRQRCCHPAATRLARLLSGPKFKFALRYGNAVPV